MSKYKPKKSFINDNEYKNDNFTQPIEKIDENEMILTQEFENKDKEEIENTIKDEMSLVNRISYITKGKLYDYKDNDFIEMLRIVDNLKDKKLTKEEMIKIFIEKFPLFKKENIYFNSKNYIIRIVINANNLIRFVYK